MTHLFQRNSLGNCLVLGSFLIDLPSGNIFQLTNQLGAVWTLFHLPTLVMHFFKQLALILSVFLLSSPQDVLQSTSKEGDRERAPLAGVSDQ